MYICYIDLDYIYSIGIYAFHMCFMLHQNAKPTIHSSQKAHKLPITSKPSTGLGLGTSYLRLLKKSKGKVGYPRGSIRDICQHIPPIYGFDNGCIGQYGVIFWEQLLVGGYPNFSI